MARRLVIMGSGETAPGMLGVHREVFAGVPQGADCLLMDSPFAFQENADELVERIGGFFADSLGHPVERVSLAAGADALSVERALARIRRAGWVFAGPGSPSYARRVWAGTPIPEALAGVVAPGRSGALVFASAAAVTLGDWSLPVYEIYKVGADPHWEPGLGIMSRTLGWRCSVVPHYDNQEGGTHDTRFCYVGGRRLAQIEGELDGAFILGVDEHTAVVLDLDRATAAVAGRGGMTLRVAGQEAVYPAGSGLGFAEMMARIADLGGQAGQADPGGQAGQADAGSVQVPGDPGPATDEGGPFRGAPADSGDPAVLAALVLGALAESATRERDALIALVERAEQAAMHHDRELAGQVVQALVDVRSSSRTAGDWAASDRLRDALASVGVEVRDTREGSTWLWA